MPSLASSSQCEEGARDGIDIWDMAHIIRGLYLMLYMSLKQIKATDTRTDIKKTKTRSKNLKIEQKMDRYVNYMK